MSDLSIVVGLELLVKPLLDYCTWHRDATEPDGQFCRESYNWRTVVRDRSASVKCKPQLILLQIKLWLRRPWYQSSNITHHKSV